MRSGISSGGSVQNISKTVSVSIDVVGLTNHATVNQTQFIRLKTVGMVKSKVESKKLDYLIYESVYIMYLRTRDELPMAYSQQVEMLEDAAEELGIPPLGDAGERGGFDAG